MPPKGSGGRGRGASQAGRPATRRQTSNLPPQLPPPPPQPTAPVSSGKNPTVKSLHADNERLKKQLQDLQETINARLPPMATVEQETPPAPPSTTRRGRKRTVNEVDDSAVSGVISDVANGGVELNKSLSNSDDNQQMDVVNVLETGNNSDNNATIAMQNQLAELRGLVASLSDSQGNTGKQNSQPGNTSQQNVMQQQIDELRATVMSLAESRGGRPFDMSDEMRVDETSVACSIKEAIGDKDVGSSESECFSNFMLAGFSVDAKTKSKIWAQNYVELGLLRGKQETRSGNQASNNNSNPNSANVPKQPGSWSEWFRLFIVYAAVYLKKFPEEMEGLLSYMLRIHNMARKDSSTYVWRDYDEQFRKIRAHAPDLPWHVTNQHILGDVQDNAILASKNNFRKQTNVRVENSKQKTGGFCFDYNDKSKFCTRNNCKYSHKCSKCSGPHPGHSCGKPATHPSSRASNDALARAAKKH